MPSASENEQIFHFYSSRTQLTSNLLKASSPYGNAKFARRKHTFPWFAVTNQIIPHMFASPFVMHTTSLRTERQFSKARHSSLVRHPSSSAFAFYRYLSLVLVSLCLAFWDFSGGRIELHELAARRYATPSNMRYNPDR